MSTCTSPCIHTTRKLHAPPYATVKYAPATLAILLLIFCRTSVAAEDQSRHCADADPESPVNSQTLAVATLNISHGRNTAMNQMFVSTKRTYENLDRIAAFLDEIDVDIVALQEADAESKWSGKFDHVRYLVDNTEFNCSIHGRHARSWLYAYGTALLAKNGLAESKSMEFEPTPPTTTKGFVQAKFDWSVNGETTPVTVVSVHLDFSSKKVRDAQINEMITVLSKLDSDLIIMGDLNSEWFDERPHVRYLAKGLGLEAYNPDGPGLGTFKSQDGKRLDWILISSRLEFVEYKVLPDVVADHLAVYAEIQYRGNE